MPESSQTRTPPPSVSNAEPFADGSQAAPPSPPPPPPLPPRLVSARPSQLPTLGTVGAAAVRAQAVYYSFHGTLMNPAILKGVLGLISEPVLRSAKIYGYELANWGQYKTLFDGNQGTVVTGRVLHGPAHRGGVQARILGNQRVQSSTLRDILYRRSGRKGGRGAHHW
ncbi:hypothetical protein N657DRAFT_645595 [Parathielavia appendiculata]|uniref:Uncharacterized protein n=1 Tax=Parathielavia appendiculata TaxID=2587402 RepID=A0AAN6U0E7_9PEZI|nr:hypothetical protein N657DRAFT_645595 [Parathielavia appendiculata]